MAELNNTPARQSSHNCTTKNRTRPAASSPDPRIEFPAEDQSWITLQERAVELTSKPIEDLSYRELQELRLDLSDTDLVTLKEYQREKRLESSNAFDGIVSCRTWKEKLCDQPLEDLIDFQDYLRAVVVTLCRLPDGSQLDGIEKDLLSFLQGFPGAEVKSGDGKAWDQSARVLRNIGRVPPTDEGIEFMENFYERTQALYEESKRPHVARPSPPTIDKGIPEWEERRRKKAAEIEMAHQSGKRVFVIHVAHVRAHFYNSYDVTARTEKEAYRKAILEVDAKCPNVRQKNWPIRVMVYSVDDKLTHDFSQTPVPWDSELVKSIKWG